MVVEFDINRLDLVRFNLHHAVHRPMIWATIIAGSAVIGSTIPKDVPLAARLIMYVLVALFMTTLSFGFVLLIATLSYARSKNRGVFGRHEVTISSSEIRETSSVSTGTWLWTAVPRVSQNRSYIYIYVQENMAHIIPKRSFASVEDAQRFYDSVRSAWLSAKAA